MLPWGPQREVPRPLTKGCRNLGASEVGFLSQEQREPKGRTDLHLENLFVCRVERQWAEAKVGTEALAGWPPPQEGCWPSA